MNPREIRQAVDQHRSHLPRWERRILTKVLAGFELTRAELAEALSQPALAATFSRGGDGVSDSSQDSDQ